MSSFLKRLGELSDAEEFLDFLGVSYDMRVVDVNRLHILKRFHDYVEQDGLPGDLDDEALAGAYSRALRRAYADFVVSNAQTEKVFRVFQTAGRNGFVPLSAIARKS